MALQFLNDGYFAGKVGIGAPAASKKLEVTGNAGIEGTLTVETSSNNIRLLDSNDSTVNFSVGVNGKFQIRDVAAVTNPFQIEKAAPSNSLYIKADGKVGIGTASPDHLLDLYKSTSTTSSTTGTTLQRLWNYVGGDLNQQKTFIDFVFQDDNSNEYPQVRIGAEVGQNGDSNTQIKEGSGAFVVYTNNATGVGPGSPTGLAERFRVDYAGNVGIGTTDPTSLLTINDGNVKIIKNMLSGGTDFDFLQLSFNGGWSGNVGGLASINFTDSITASNTVGRIGVTYTGSQGKFVITDLYSGGYSASGDVFTIQADGQTYIKGNVGIGTASPDKLLHVGDGSATLSAPQGAEIEGYNNTLDVKTNEANNISDFTPAINLFCDGVTGSSGTGTGIYFRAQTGGGGGGEYTKGRIQGAVYTSWTTNTDATRTSKLVIQTTNSGTHADRVTILGNGDFGINDTSPSNKLDVNGDIRGTQYKLRGNVSNPTSTAATIYDQSGVGLTLSAHNVELRNYNGSSMVRSVFFTHNTATFTGTCTATNFILSSDETLKDNIKDIDNKHIDVNWKNFELKSEPGIKRAGVIAQELETKHPEFVRTNKDGLKSVAYIDLLIAKIAELEARLEKAGI